MIKSIGTALGILALAACSSSDVEYKYPEKYYGRYERPSEITDEMRSNKLFDDDTLTFKYKFAGKKDKKPSIKKTSLQPKVAEQKSEPLSTVKPEHKSTTGLWAGVMPVMSQYPIAMIKSDDFISTEWFTDPQNASHQYKVNVLKQEMDVKVTVLSRIKDSAGEWVNQNNDQKLAVKIKNDIVKQTIH